MSDKVKKRKRRFGGRLAIFLTLLVIVCIVLFLTNFLGFASLRRLSYRIFDGVSGDGTEETINFNENQSNAYAFLDGNLGVISPDTLSVYDLSGSPTFSSPVLLRTPALSTTGTELLAYDLGGLNYYVADEDEILLSKTTDSRILNANLNTSGGFTITTDSPDCKTLVTAFNSDHEVIYKFHSSQKYVFDAALSPDEDTIAIATYGTSDGFFETGFALCHTDKQSFFSETNLGTSMPLQISYISDNRISVICDDRALLFDSSGTLVSETSYNSKTLKTFSTASDHVAILLFDPHISDNIELIVLKEDGKVKSLTITEAVFSLSTAEGYTALLYDECCTVYNNDLTRHCEVATSSKTADCLVNDDGSVLLLSDNSATFYVK